MTLVQEQDWVKAMEPRNEFDALIEAGNKIDRYDSYMLYRSDIGYQQIPNTLPLHVQCYTRGLKLWFHTKKKVGPKILDYRERCLCPMYTSM